MLQLVKAGAEGANDGGYLPLFGRAMAAAEQLATRVSERPSAADGLLCICSGAWCCRISRASHGCAGWMQGWDSRKSSQLGNTQSERRAAGTGAADGADTAGGGAPGWKRLGVQQSRVEEGAGADAVGWSVVVDMAEEFWALPRQGSAMTKSAPLGSEGPALFTWAGTHAQPGH